MEIRLPTVTGAPQRQVQAIPGWTPGLEPVRTSAGELSCPALTPGAGDLSLVQQPDEYAPFLCALLLPTPALVLSCAAGYGHR
jgi:hypothetical protein